METPSTIQAEVEAYLSRQEHKSLLRFITCGSVDDGKSTLIGRLLYESQMIFDDQLAALEADSRRAKYRSTVRSGSARSAAIRSRARSRARPRRWPRSSRKC